MTAKPPPSPEEAAQHRSWRRWTIGSVVVLVLLLLPFAALWIYDARLVAEAEHLISKLDREVPGWREPKPDREPPPPERDSMLVLRRVVALLPKKWDKELFESTDSDIGTDSYPPPCLLRKQDVDDLAAALKRSTAALAEARTLTDVPVGRYERTRSEDGTHWTYFEKAFELRTPLYLLQYANLDAIQRGEIAQAWNDCRAQLEVGKVFQEGEVMIALIRMSVGSTTIKSLERTLAHGEVGDSDLAAMQKALADEAEVDLYFPYLPAEFSFWLRVFDEMIARPNDKASRAMLMVFGEKEEDRGWWRKLNDRYPRFMLLRSRVESLERLAKAYELHPLRGFTRHEAFERLGKQFGPVAGDGTDRLTWNLSTQMKIVGAERRVHAFMHCAEVALAAERFRLKHGEWPGTATELVDKGLLARVPEDPFDGNPLRFRHFAEGIVVYAVGPKMSYDGTDWDDFDNLDSKSREGTEFRLWNPDRRHQPALPERKGWDS